MTGCVEKSLLQYYFEIERERKLIDVNCREIQLAIKRYENKLLTDQLVKQEEEVRRRREEEPSIDLTEVDELIRKAQKVFLYDAEGKKPKALPDKNRFPSKIQHASSEPIKTSQVSYQPIKGSNIPSKANMRQGSAALGVSATTRRTERQYPSRQTASFKCRDTKVVGRATSGASSKQKRTDHKDLQKEVKVNDESHRLKNSHEPNHSHKQKDRVQNERTFPSHPISCKSFPYFETTFKEQYCINRHLWKKLDKTTRDRSIVKDRSGAIADFLDLLHNNGSNALQQNIDNALPNRTAAAREMIRGVRDARNIADNILHKYTDEDENELLASLSQDVINIRQGKLTELLTNHFKLKHHLFEKKILNRLNDAVKEWKPSSADGQHALLWRQIHLLLCGDCTLPALVKEPYE